MAPHEALQDLDMTGNLFPCALHSPVWNGTFWKALTVCNPEILLDQLVAAMWLAFECVLATAHLWDIQKSYKIISPIFKWDQNLASPSRKASSSSGGHF
jgi:hypothetical protein